MRQLADLINTQEPAIVLIREWVQQAEVHCELLPPSSRREQVLLGAQVTTRSPLGALAYESGGLLIDGGWLRFLGSGHPALKRDLVAWNEPRSSGFYLVADDAVGGFFALNGGSLGDDVGNVYYWPPDNLNWEGLEITFTEFLQLSLTSSITQFYSDLRWPTWQEDLAPISADRCFFFYPFLWTTEGSLTSSHRGDVPVEEAFDLKVDIIRQLTEHST